MTVTSKGAISLESAIKGPKEGRLTAAFVRSVNRPGVYCDQHGLRLRVCESRKLKSISKHWVYRDDNPAGDAISAALPKTGTMRKHRRALPFADVGAALDKVKTSGAFKSTVLALEFLVLTACRSSEVRLATWDEVDLDSGTCGRSRRTG